MKHNKYWVLFTRLVIFSIKVIARRAHKAWINFRGQLWFLVPGVVLFVAGVTAGVLYKKSLGIDLACSLLFIAGIVLIAVAVSRAGGGEAERPAARVEKPKAPEAKPEAKKERGAKRKKDTVSETVSWNI